jgi:hypothetical protein
LSKAELIKMISEINKTDSSSPLSDKVVHRNDNGSIGISTKYRTLFDIRTPTMNAQWSKKKVRNENPDMCQEDTSTENEDRNWLPDSVVNEVGNDDTQSSIFTHSRDFI